MTYDPDLYCFRSDQEEAKLSAGAYLYRVTDREYVSRNQILNGRGGLHGEGRFNRTGQLVSYCSNNVQVCLAEVLFHQYHEVIRRLTEGRSPGLVEATYSRKRVLTICRVKEISRLAYLNSSYVQRKDGQMRGTRTVLPHVQYDVYHDMRDKLTTSRKRGVYYHSARHSRDVCLALFRDMTRSVQEGPMTLNVNLKLVPEDLDVGKPVNCRHPLDCFIHPTMGYYSFSDKEDFERMKNDGKLSPADLPQEGLLDFVRRTYPTGYAPIGATYSKLAVVSTQSPSAP